jgi:lysosomal Pro-X carboxypeptidase
MCRRIDAFPKGSDKIDMVLAAANVYYNYTGNQKCFQIEKKSDPHGLSGWNWQVQII